MSPDIDWATPIKVRRGQPPYGVRQEQLRRAAILIEAAGGKMPKGQRELERRLGALAELIPGLRYAVGALSFETLAPDLSVMADSRSRPGRPQGTGRWTTDRLLALVEMVDRTRASSPRPLTDAQALARIRKGSIEYCKAQSEAAGLTFDDAARKHAEMPEVETLANYLARGRRIRREKV